MFSSFNFLWRQSNSSDNTQQTLSNRSSILNSWSSSNTHNNNQIVVDSEDNIETELDNSISVVVKKKRKYPARVDDYNYQDVVNAKAAILANEGLSQRSPNYKSIETIAKEYNMTSKLLRSFLSNKDIREEDFTVKKCGRTKTVTSYMNEKVNEAELTKGNTINI